MSTEQPNQHKITDATALIFSLPSDPSSTKSVLPFQSIKKHKKLQHTRFSDPNLDKGSSSLATDTTLISTIPEEEPLDDTLSFATIQALKPVKRPPPVVQARQPVASIHGSKSLLALQQRLKADSKSVNQLLRHQKNSTATSATDFLTLVSEKADIVYINATTDLIKYLESRDKVAAGVLNDIWTGYRGLVDNVRSKLVNEVILARNNNDKNEEDAAKDEENDKAAQEEEERLAEESRLRDEMAARALAASLSAGEFGAGGGLRRSMLARPSISLSLFGNHADRRGNAFSKDQLVTENSDLRTALAAATSEVTELRRKVANLRVFEDAAHEAEAKARAAETERDALQRVLTPRPKRRLDLQAAALSSLVEGAEGQQSQPQQPVLIDDSELSEETVMAVERVIRECGDIGAAELASFLTTKPDKHELPASSTTPTNFATDSTTSSIVTTAAAPSGQQPVVPVLPTWQVTASSLKGCLSTIDTATVSKAISLLRLPTTTAYARLESELAALRTENAAMWAELSAHQANSAKIEAAKRRREEEAALEKKNPIQEYIDLLTSQGEEAWKESLIGMGLAVEVPKLFRHAGKVRNKHLSKRDTEKMIKELWKERMTDPAVAAGRASELLDFLGSQLQKRFGIAMAVLEMAYNFLYGLWLYKYDADCELFLKILIGETPEDVYIAQVKLQQELEELFAALDKAKGTPTGILDKTEVRTALIAFWRVDEVGGKTQQRFDEAMEALDHDQPGEKVEWKKVFEEDREFNQGEFAESIRDQFLQERMDYFNTLETALYSEAADQGDVCCRDSLLAALLIANPTTLDKDARKIVTSVFPPGIDELSVKAVMKKMSRGVGRSTATSERMSVAVAGAGGRKGSAGKGSISVAGGNGKGGALGKDKGGGIAGQLARPAGQQKMTEGIARALEAVRKEWIRAQVSSTASGSITGGGSQNNELDAPRYNEGDMNIGRQQIKEEVEEEGQNA